jgi:hypothetical protein
MKIALTYALALTAFVATSPVASARPGTGKPDCSAALATVETAVAAACDCATAVNHGQYVRCAGKVVKSLAADATVGRSCKGAMVRVFAKSTCGKPDAVACCVASECHVRKSVACTHAGGTVGVGPFCADACKPASPSGAFVE